MKIQLAALMAVAALTACHRGGGNAEPMPVRPAEQPSQPAPGPGAVAPMSPADPPSRGGSAPSRSGMATAGPSLFTRLGGVEAIRAVVHDFVGRVAADDRINAFFRGVDIPHLEQMLTEQICSASGGPCTYTGKSMREVHTGMNLTDEHFNALVSDLVAALNRFNVPAREQSDLLVALSALKPDIVGH
jgi:hemoglobin